MSYGHGNPKHILIAYKIGGIVIFDKIFSLALLVVCYT